MASYAFKRGVFVILILSNCRAGGFESPFHIGHILVNHIQVSPSRLCLINTTQIYDARYLVFSLQDWLLKIHKYCPSTKILETIHCEGFGSSPGSRVTVIVPEIEMPVCKKKDIESIVQDCSSIW